MPVTQSFADMGIAAPEMGHGPRASMYGPVDGNLNYAQWAQAQGINRNMDGGLADLPAGKPPKSPGAAPVRVAPLKAKGVMQR